MRKLRFRKLQDQRAYKLWVRIQEFMLFLNSHILPVLHAMDKGQEYRWLALSREL